MAHGLRPDSGTRLIDINFQGARLGLLEALNHLANFLLAPIGVGCIAAALAKLAWRRELRAVPWRRLAGWGSAGATFAAICGLLVLGRDGAMGTYAGMVVASAVALIWAGFGHPAR